jgi:hypothetical protein
MEGPTLTGYKTMEREAGHKPGWQAKTSRGKVKHNDWIGMFPIPHPGGQGRITGPPAAKAITLTT